MKDLTRETSASGVEYAVTGQIFDSLSEAVESIDGGEEGVLDVINSAQEQNFKQGAKDPVREAIAEFVENGGDKETLQGVVDGDFAPESTAAPDEAQSVLDAIEAHRENAQGYIVGRPRGASGGVTKTDSRKMGEKIREKVDGDREKMEEIAESLGLDPDEIFG